MLIIYSRENVSIVVLLNALAEVPTSLLETGKLTLIKLSPSH